MDRIRDQIGSLPRLKSGGTLRVTAEKIPAPPAGDPSILEQQVEQQVWGIADYVTEVVNRALGAKKTSPEKENHDNAHKKS